MGRKCNRNRLDFKIRLMSCDHPGSRDLQLCSRPPPGQPLVTFNHRLRLN